MPPVLFCQGGRPVGRRGRPGGNDRTEHSQDRGYGTRSAVDRYRRGRETRPRIFASHKLGNCLACHVNSNPKNELFHGEVGLSLDGVGARWSAAQLRAIVVDSKQVFGDEAIMPGFYTLKVGINVDEKFAGKTILSAQEVEDVVAYLTTLNQE